jgi:hypothetical protein
MNLRQRTATALRWSWRLALLGVALLALGRGAPAADAGTSSYPSPLYLSGKYSTSLPYVSSTVTGSYALVGNAGPGTPSAVTLAAGAAGGLTGSYSYLYTVVDPTGGESAVREGTAPTVTVTAKVITVNGLPTGVTVRLYRKKTGLFTRVAELPNNASSSYTDSMDDTTAASQPTLPQTQNRIALNTTGYQDFAPGVWAPFSGNTTVAASPSTTPNGMGWIVDGSGNVSFPTNTWTFQAKLGQNALFGTARLVVGMWKVTVSAGAITASSLLVDPTCGAAPCGSGAAPGENTTSFTTSGAVFSKVITHAVTVNGFALASGEHLYVQFWRKQQTSMAGGSDTNRTATLFGYDGTTQIQHPAANEFPNAPTLGAVAARINTTTPQLSATFENADATEAETLTFQLCSDSACGTVLQTHTATGVANGATENWTPTALSEGTYYWRAQAQDSAATTSGWSTGSFTVDTTAPNVPALTFPAASARGAQLTATYGEPDTADTGTVAFEVCTDSACSSVVASSTSASVGNGATVSWTPGVADGTYYWRVKAQDPATNASAWSATRSFRLDTVAPDATALDSPGDGSALASLPSLSAKYLNTDAGDSGPLSFQICSDSACSNVEASGSSGTLTNNAVGSWKPSSLADGTHYVRVRALDVAGNAGPWSNEPPLSATRSFYLDMTPPPVPTGSGVAAGARITHAPTLTASYADGSGSAGTVTIQVCSDNGCSRVVASTAPSAANGTSASWTPSLGDGKYYWRARAQDALGNQSAWSASSLFIIDTTPPPAPTLVSAAGLRSKTAPVLAARTTRSDPDESMRLAFQVCSDPACALIRALGYATAEGGDATAQWQPPALTDGVYYWRAFAVDGAANESGWSATRPFVIDNTPPDVPILSGHADDRVKTADLAATFAGADPSDSGTLFFELCADADCATVIATGSDDGLVSGSVGRWTAALLRDGDYYWRACAEDAAGNGSDWSPAQHFSLDRTPPAKPRDFAGTLTSNTLSLRWKAPAASDSIAGYVLYVNGNRSRSVDASSLDIDIRVRAGDSRSFAVAAVDSTGNIGPRTRAVVLVPQLARLTLDQAKAATAGQGLLLRWSKKTARATPKRVIGQSPAPQTIVETGSLVTVVVDGPARAPRR